MKVFTILMLAVAAVYAWDDGDNENHDDEHDYEHHKLLLQPPYPPPPAPLCAYTGPTCEVLPVGGETIAPTSAPGFFVSNFPVSVSWDT